MCGKTLGYDAIEPPPREHRHRYRRVLAPNHTLRRAVTALTIGNCGRRRDAATGGHAVGNAAEDCCVMRDKPRSRDTARIAWADPEDPYASRRNHRIAASLSRPGPAHRPGQARPGPRDAQSPLTVTPLSYSRKRQVFIERRPVQPERRDFDMAHIFLGGLVRMICPH